MRLPRFHRKPGAHRMTATAPPPPPAGGQCRAIGSVTKRRCALPATVGDYCRLHAPTIGPSTGPKAT
jgi:hypothetical protein